MPKHGLGWGHDPENGWGHDPEKLSPKWGHDPERSQYDFIFLPNYRLDDIRHMSFDLVMNVASMQEMREDQVRSYIDFIHATLAGTFFSWNTDRHPRNAELSNLTEILESEFDATEIPTRTLTSRKRRSLPRRLGRLLRSAGDRLDPPLDAGPKMRYRMFLCRERNGPEGGVH